MQSDGGLKAHPRAVWLRAAQNVAYNGDYYILTPDEAVPLPDGEDYHRGGAAQGRRVWKLLWIPAIALLLAWAGKAYIKRSAKGGEASAVTDHFSRQQLHAESDEFDTGQRSSSDGEVPYTELDTRREFHMHAPLLPQGDQPFDVDPSLRPRTVPSVLGGQAPDEEAPGAHGLPKSWLHATDKHPASLPVPEAAAAAAAAAPPQKNDEWEWLELCQVPQQSGRDEKEGTLRQQHHQISSFEALSLARKLDAGVDAGAYPLPKEDIYTALKRRYARLLKKINPSHVEGFFQTMMAAREVRSTSWNAVSRSLRAELLVADVASDLLRVEERQEEALHALQHAAQRLEATRGSSPQADEAAESARAEALVQYRSLLASESLLLTNLLEHTSLWRAEVERLLTNVSSVLSSDSFKEIEAIGECQGGYFGLGKASIKVVAMTNSMSKETRSKIRAVHITDLVKIRLEHTKYRLMHAERWNAPEVVAQIASFKEKAQAARAEGRKNLAKKKANSWFLDVL